MLTRLRSRLTYANVVATIALFVALGGGAYAVLKLPKNSVKSKQIKNGQVKNKTSARTRSTAPRWPPARSARMT